MGKISQEIIDAIAEIQATLAKDNSINQDDLEILFLASLLNEDN